MAFDNSYWSGRACVRSVEDWGLATIAGTGLHCLQHQHRLHRSAKLQTDRLEEKTIQDIMRRNEVLKEILGTGYWVLSVHYLRINQNISISDYKGHREVSLRTFQ